MLHERAAGILLPVSSLPSPYGIGSFGNAAREWLRFLNAGGQKYWQILPLGPTGWGDSPYQSFSAFAISPYYVDLPTLIEQKFLLESECAAIRWNKRADAVDYGALYQHRETLLRLACERFIKSESASKKNSRVAKKTAGTETATAFESFRSVNSFWLDDYSLFMALKTQHKGRVWFEWDKPLRLRDKTALEKIKMELATELYFHSFVQFLAHTQWQSIRDYARKLGIAIIGDMPIYVAADSADAWSNSALFQLDKNCRPLRVAGCPPDPFSAGGQLWGNPLYRWDVIAKNGFAWWIARLRSGFDLYDIVRIDHFCGFERYYSIDAKAPDAVNGKWVKGPGLQFIDAVNRELPNAAIIAEDLGFLTPEVKALLAASGYPGMKVLQFAFDSREVSCYMPYLYERNCVVYTGTHDNSSSLGWLQTANPDDVQLALDFFGLNNGKKNKKEATWAFIRCALASVANTAIIPMQDYLGLDDRARINIPATLGNWRWRMLPAAASTDLAEKIRRLTVICGRGTA